MWFFLLRKDEEGRFRYVGTLNHVIKVKHLIWPVRDVEKKVYKQWTQFRADFYFSKSELPFYQSYFDESFFIFGFHPLPLDSIETRNFDAKTWNFIEGITQHTQPHRRSIPNPPVLECICEMVDFNTFFNSFEAEEEFQEMLELTLFQKYPEKGFYYYSFIVDMKHFRNMDFDGQHMEYVFPICDKSFLIPMNKNLVTRRPSVWFGMKNHKEFKRRYVYIINGISNGGNCVYIPPLKEIEPQNHILVNPITVSYILFDVDIALFPQDGYIEIFDMGRTNMRQPPNIACDLTCARVLLDHPCFRVSKKPYATGWVIHLELQYNPTTECCINENGWNTLRNHLIFICSWDNCMENSTRSPCTIRPSIFCGYKEVIFLPKKEYVLIEMHHHEGYLEKAYLRPIIYQRNVKSDPQMPLAYMWFFKDLNECNNTAIRDAPFDMQIGNSIPFLHL